MSGFGRLSVAERRRRFAPNDAASSGRSSGPAIRLLASQRCDLVGVTRSFDDRIGGAEQLERVRRIRAVDGDACEELVRACDVRRVVGNRGGLERAARVAVRRLPVASLFAERRLRAPSVRARAGYRARRSASTILRSTSAARSGRWRLSPSREQDA